MTQHLRLINSVIAFALAALASITLHELAHAIAGLMLGGHPVMFGFSVDQGPISDAVQIVTALAGPVFSLVSGLVVLAVPANSLPTFWRLAWLWFGLLSVQEFAGYLITGPFVSAGDIGLVLAAADAPLVVAIGGFVVGWVITYFLGWLATRRLATFTTDGPELAPQLRELGLFAWLIGSLLAVVLSLGLLGAGDVDVPILVFEAAGVISSGIFLIFVRLFLAAASDAPHLGPVLRVPIAGAVVLFLVAVVRQVVLSRGVAL
ncbi:hypothetical protein GCM10010464_49280 [Pseudonocardia yunnanensis]|uniref:M50 family peptidase n=1 Tax=Pseudonocardia yunnanensis TaxID=58107 RepID=A0ABW4EQ34_9PSEU